MATANVVVTIKLDSNALDRAAVALIEAAIAASVEPAVKRELRRQLDEIREAENGDRS